MNTDLGICLLSTCLLKWIKQSQNYSTLKRKRKFSLLGDCVLWFISYHHFSFGFHGTTLPILLLSASPYKTLGMEGSWKSDHCHRSWNAKGYLFSSSSVTFLEFVYIYVCVCIFIYIHTHIFIYTYTHISYFYILEVQI